MESAYYVHEDDYCQQELLPRAAAGFVASEMQKSEAFAAAHEVPGGAGWTDMYVRQTPPAELQALGIGNEEFAWLVAPHLPQFFDKVYSGYGSTAELCGRAAAWGASENTLIAEWNEKGVIRAVWAEFSNADTAALRAAAQAVAALGARYPLIYVDWAWSYTCAAEDADAFAAMLEAKLKEIERRLKP